MAEDGDKISGSVSTSYVIVDLHEKFKFVDPDIDMKMFYKPVMHLDSVRSSDTSSSSTSHSLIYTC